MKCPVISYRATSINNYISSPNCLLNNATSLACRSFSFDTDVVPLGEFFVYFNVIADGGAHKDTSVGINVVCSLNTVDYEKKFVVPFLESDNMLEVVKAYNYFEAGFSCPLEFSMK